MEPKNPESMIQVVRLTPHPDSRGVLSEIYRREWGLPVLAQMNLVVSEPNALRGVHFHEGHEDYLLVISGVLVLGLHDLRPGSPTCGESALIGLTGNPRQAVRIPIGVGHGFYFPEPTTYVYGLTAPWSPEGERGCRWDDPELDIPWPCTDPILSERDAQAGSLADLRAALS